MRVSTSGVMGLVCFTSLFGCSASAGNADFGSDGSGGQNGFMGFGQGASSGEVQGHDECGGDVYRGEGTVLDMYILLDRSGSMIGLGSNPWISWIPGITQALGPDIWGPVTTALNSFVTRPEVAGISAGITFFPLPLSANSSGETCDTNVYASPAAAIAPLPANGAAIQAAIDAHSPPRGGTPTRPALEGAMAHARSWAEQNPTHKVVIVLATDGAPNDCSSTVDSVAAIATSGLNSGPRIETYVIGIGNIDGLNRIAEAGGTGQALIVSADPSVASQQFFDAMDAIRGRAVPCDYGVPEAGRKAPNLVNVKFSAGGGEVTIPYVQESGRCDPAAGGWYYDNVASPDRIITCPATCGTISETVEAQVRVVVGCEQIVQ